MSLQPLPQTPTFPGEKGAEFQQHPLATSPKAGLQEGAHPFRGCGSRVVLGRGAGIRAGGLEGTLSYSLFLIPCCLFISLFLFNSLIPPRFHLTIIWEGEEAGLSNHPKADFSSCLSRTARKNPISQGSSASLSQGCSVAPPKALCKQPLTPDAHTEALHFICWWMILLLIKHSYLMYLLFL